MQFKDWTKKFWKEYELNLDEQFEDHSTIDETVTFMLAGLHWDIEDGFEIETASDDLIQRAIALGLLDSLEFPTWFEKLIRDKSNLAKPILEEFTLQSFEQEKHGFFLNKLPDASESIRKIFASLLIQHLQKQNSNASSVNFYALQTLMRTSLNKEQTSLLTELSRKQCEISFPQDSEENFVHWWFLLATLSPTAAIQTLRHNLSLKENEESILSLFSAMGNIVEQQRVFDEPPQFDFLSDIYFLKEFLPIFFKWVSPENDIHFRNGENHPAFYREEAQWVRNYFSSSLLSHQDKTAPEVIRELSNNPSMTSVAPQLLRHAIINEVQNTGLNPHFTSVKAAQWIQELSTTVENSDQLFEAVVSAIEDINFFFQHDDLSFFSLIRNQKPNERHIQPLIASELRHRLLNQNISINREPEVINRKEPDLRIEKGNKARVCIEIKIFQNKRESEIEESLETQLVEKYMRDVHSNHGIYLICNIPSDSKDKPKKGFNALISRLTEKANNIQNKNESIEELKVLAINF